MNIVNVLVPVVLRFGLMLATLGATQLTYWQFSESTFLALNTLVFLVGLHTALTYSVQVGIWETGVAHIRELIVSALVAAIIMFVAWLFLPSSISFLVGGFVYILYRFADRLAFNSLITRGKISLAYCVSTCVIVFEVLAFFLLPRNSSEAISRFLIPGLIGGAGAFAAYVWVASAHRAPSASKNNGVQEIGFALHSLAILLVIMIDRIGPNLNSALSFLDGRYLLLFAYCGAAYSLGVAILEPYRPRYFLIAKKVKVLSEFFKESNARITVLIAGGFGGITFTVPLCISVATGFVDPAGLSGYVKDIYIIGGLLSFFSFFLFLAYVQMFFLARRDFRALLISWGGALAIRGLAMTTTRIDIYLLLSIISALLALFILHRLGSKSERCL